MSYYDTIEEDIARAKQILANGKSEFDLPHLNTLVVGGTIYGQDTYAAYKLLESFVAHIEAQKTILSDTSVAHMREMRELERENAEQKATLTALEEAGVPVKTVLRAHKKADAAEGR